MSATTRQHDTGPHYHAFTGDVLPEPFPEGSYHEVLSTEDLRRQNLVPAFDPEGVPCLMDPRFAFPAKEAEQKRGYEEEHGRPPAKRRKTG